MDNSSFWSDIKKFEDTLAKDSSSYCFAPLAELYRKTGLLEDAISTAIKGTALHPEYVGGYMALGRAYLDKGQKTEALEALQRVVSFTPENMMAQKLLCQMYSESGNIALLRKTLGTLLMLNPSDTESRLLLESLERVSPSDSGSFDGSDIRVELIPDEEAVAGLEELDPLDDSSEVADLLPVEAEHSFFATEASDEPVHEEVSRSDGLPSTGIHTATIAELYVAQGHLDLAVDIYLELLEEFPGNSDYLSRIAELEELISGKDEPDTVNTDPWSTGEIFSCQPPEAGISCDPELYPPHQAATEDDSLPLSLLQGWLDTIRRVKECRSVRS